MAINKDFLLIDELRLDKECLRQPSLYFEHAEKLAAARLSYDEACSDLDLVRAELDAKVRARPVKYGLAEKSTEAAIKAAIITLDEYKTAQQQVFDAKHKVDIYQAAVTALEHKKRALTLLVTLAGQQYFAEPKTTREGRDAVDDNTKKAVRKLGQRKPDVDEDDED